MAPRLLSFKPMWTKLNVCNRIENTVSPEKPMLPKRNPLSLSTSSLVLSSSNQVSSSKSQSGSTSSRRTKEAQEDEQRLTEEPGSLNLSVSLRSSCDEKENIMHSSRSVDSAGAMCSARSNKTPREEDVPVPQLQRRLEEHLTVNQETRVSVAAAPLDISIQDAAELEAEVMGDEPDDLESGMFRALIITDTHLGYKENDPVRGNDAFNAFEEALYLAKNLRVDAIFHSGDLFDESYPSRNVMYRSMDLLRKYCRLSENKRPDSLLQVEFPKGVKTHNEDKRRILINTLNVKIPNERRLPFFVIHGNHDNPNGINDLSPIDLLDVANLATYFGTPADLNQVELHPVLLKKGDSRLALYGLSWVKDESLYLAFQENRVVFFPPPEDEHQWYHVLLFHQNRYPRNSKSFKDYIPEDFLPKWLDLVIWGHEHECMRDPQASKNGNFQVLQLGSTVPTSMCAAEMPSKHCCLMELTSERVDFYPITLETVRQLQYAEVRLSQMELEDNTEKAISDKLTTIMENILKEFKTREKTLLRASMLTKVVSSSSKFNLQDAIDDANRLPLVRLRVEHTGFQSINPRTFGNAFKGRVANPMDVLRFWQKRKPMGSVNNKKPEENIPESVDNSSQSVKHMVLSSIGDDCRLKLLLEKELTAAVERFASGMEVQAISEFVRRSVSEAEEFLTEELEAHAGEQITEDIYNQLIERSLLTKTQAGRILSVTSRMQAGDQKRNTVALDASFKSIPSCTSSPGRRLETDMSMPVTSAKNAFIEILENSSVSSCAKDAILSTPSKNATVQWYNPKRLDTEGAKEKTLSKRSFAEAEKDITYSPPRTRRRHPLESINLQTGIAAYELVKQEELYGKPLKLSDIEDELTPIRNHGTSNSSDISPGEESGVDAINRRKLSLGSNTTTLPLREWNAAADKKARNSSSSAAGSGQQQSSISDGSSLGSSQKSTSPGAASAIISMFFKPRKS